MGGIACEGPTLTVRLFSRVPIDRLRSVQVDTDSHTSVALLGVLLREVYGVSPTLVHHDPRAGGGGRGGALPDGAEAVLLIGDKVVTDAPDAAAFGHQLDLGEAWHELTGRPFVFAMWMKRRGTDLGDLPAVLERQLTRNLGRLEEIGWRPMPADHGWPADLAAD